MPNYAKAQIGGHLGKDPEFKTTQTGKELCNFTVAHSTGKDEKKKTHWHKVTVWGDHVDSCRGLTKGAGVEISGNLEVESWTDKDGNQRQSHVIVVQWAEQFVKPYEKDDKPKEAPKPSYAPHPVDDMEDNIPF